MAACWEGLFERHPEAWRDAYVVMPNHFHAVLRIHARPTNKPNHLAYLIQGFKSFTTHEYHAMARDGRCPDIGTRLWQSSYYDNLITTRSELENIRAYIRSNPARWDQDRFGPVTAYHCGNLELLNRSLVAYVASEQGRQDRQDTEVLPHDRDGMQRSRPTGWGAEAPPRDIVAVRWGGEVPAAGAAQHPSRGSGPLEAVRWGGEAPAAGTAQHPSRGSGPLEAVRWGGEAPAAGTAQHPSRGSGPPCPDSDPDPDSDPAPVISTFTSPQERAVLARCLAGRRAYVHVLPGGIPEPLPQAWAQACADGRVLLLSPSPSGTGVNKQRAVWCNRYVLDHASCIWHGHIRPGGSLETLLRTRTRHASPGQRPGDWVENMKKP
ncbi:MAG: transposase [Kiritimatiellia bacterium]